jgi:ATP-dependent exoDNAse (exonuclease V) beta subunit
VREAAAASGDIEFSWAGETARHIGSVVHRWLQNIAEDEMKGWDRTRIEGLRPAFRNELAAQGVEESGLATAAGRVVAALANSLEDERGRWLLGPQRDARNEYRITAVLDGVQRHLVIDRLFTDAEGRRRIIDYKTGGHEGADVEVHLDREQARYRAQLERYAAALGGGQPGLYFPLLSGWREWPSGSDGA